MSEASVGFGAGDHADVLIVIPCLNEQTHLPGLLDALLHDARGALVVVADGGSSDASRSIVAQRMLRHANLRLLDNPKRIQSAGVNLAAQLFGGGRRWLVRVDAHCDYPANYVDRLKTPATARGADAVSVPMVSRGRACFQIAAAAAQNSVLGTGGSPHRHLSAGRWVDHGHHALFDLARFLEAGGYDEAFSHNEDAELDRRLRDRGARIWLEPAAAITYYPRSALLPLLHQYRNYGRGRARNLARHPDRMKLRQILPLGVVPAILLAPLGLALGAMYPAALLLALPAAVWIVATLAGGVALGLRSPAPCAMVAGCAALAMHAGWGFGFVTEWLRLRLTLDRLSAPPLPLHAVAELKTPAPAFDAVTICVCTFRRESLFETLESFTGLTGLEGRAVKVVVVDNDEDDGLRDAVEWFAAGYALPLTYIHAPARNISIARNAALDTVQTRWAAFIDDDEVADPNWLAMLFEGHEGYHAVIGQSRAVYPSELPGWAARCDFHSNRITGRPDNAYTSNALLDVDFVRAQKVRFREGLGRTGGEDTMFFRQMTVAGASIVYRPGSIVYETVPPQRATMAWVRRRKYRSGQVHGLLCREFEPGQYRKLFATAGAKLVLSAGMALLTIPGTDASRRWTARAFLHAGALHFRVRPAILEEYA